MTTREEHLTRARARLLTLLEERYGYHKVASPTFERSPYYSGWPYYCEPAAVDCDMEKPIRIFIEEDHLSIVHGRCITWEQDMDYDHEEKFLKAMIPVIGRLDAQAFLEGKRGHSGPWLRIYL